MAPSSKNAAVAKDRRKSANSTAPTVVSAGSPKPTQIVTLKVPAQKLRAILDPDFIKEDTPAKQSPAAAATSGTENASDSTPNSPPAGTPAAQSVAMGPPTEGPKKKGVKRSATAAANGNGEPKVRGKPGPKKKQRLEDGTIEGGRGSLAAHKLGPKANQGAINAGLRALDRSGKPCRKWNRGGFTLKTFTGVVWEIPRWTAPPKPRPEESADGSTAASESSNKENKEDNSQVKSEASNNGGDVEMQGTPSFAADKSPAPVPIAAA
ncbi:INO80 complex, subunit Ies4 [Chaetomium tenue]|uniref:INO80 complex, subunit Ies4 n=1 Tax=Chaetomium tenue TaxID=1854479 RepID=A0ACB7PP91_9PEZI|nr:INO80 complex, subunit Ies4 [Chaetomium globosum]